MMEIWKFIADNIDSGKKVALATVIERKGSAPRSVGSKMAISEDGNSYGSVGGGALEAVVEGRLKELLKKGGRELFLHRMDARRIEDGMVCGGSVKILLEVIGPENREYLEILRRLKGGKRVFILKKLPPDQGISLYEDMPDKKENEFVDIASPNDRLVIFGGGHISYFLSKIASLCNFDVFIYDDREEFSLPDRFPDAVEVKKIDYREAGNFVEPTDYVVVVTASHLSDKVALEGILKKKPTYVGMIGSKRKAKKIKDSLLESGLSDEEIRSIRSPVGIEIGAETPSEIAVSIMAEIIRERRGGNGLSNS